MKKYKRTSRLEKYKPTSKDVEKQRKSNENFANRIREGMGITTFREMGSLLFGNKFDFLQEILFEQIQRGLAGIYSLDPDNNGIRNETHIKDLVRDYFLLRAATPAQAVRDLVLYIIGHGLFYNFSLELIPIEQEGQHQCSEATINAIAYKESNAHYVLHSMGKVATWVAEALKALGAKTLDLSNQKLHQSIVAIATWVAENSEADTLDLSNQNLHRLLINKLLTAVFTIVKHGEFTTVNLEGNDLCNLFEQTDYLWYAFCATIKESKVIALDIEWELLGEQRSAELKKIIIKNLAETYINNRKAAANSVGDLALLSLGEGVSAEALAKQDIKEREAAANAAGDLALLCLGEKVSAEALADPSFKDLCERKRSSGIDDADFVTCICNAMKKVGVTKLTVTVRHLTGDKWLLFCRLMRESEVIEIDSKQRFTQEQKNEIMKSILFNRIKRFARAYINNSGGKDKAATDVTSLFIGCHVPGELLFDTDFRELVRTYQQKDRRPFQQIVECICKIVKTAKMAELCSNTEFFELVKTYKHKGDHRFHEKIVDHIGKIYKAADMAELRSNTEFFELVSMYQQQCDFLYLKMVECIGQIFKADGIKSLNLSDKQLNRLTPADWGNLGVLLNAAGMTTLYISKNNLNALTPLQKQDFLAALAGSNITSLGICGNNLSPNELEEIASILATNKRKLNAEEEKADEAEEILERTVLDELPEPVPVTLCEATFFNKPVAHEQPPVMLKTGDDNTCAGRSPEEISKRIDAGGGSAQLSLVKQPTQQKKRTLKT